MSNIYIRPVCDAHSDPCPFLPPGSWIRIRNEYFPGAGSTSGIYSLFDYEDLLLKPLKARKNGIGSFDF
jgi:hypothetical protein